MNQTPLTTRWSPLAAAVLLVLPAAAQTPPAPPALRPPPERGAWTISYKNDKPKQSAAPPARSGDAFMVNPAAFAPAAEVKSRQYTINGKLAKSLTLFSDGKTLTVYIVGMFGIRERAEDPKDLVLDHLSSPFFAGSDFRTHFPGLEWVRPEKYKGVVKLGDLRCHYFAEGAPPAQPLSNMSVFSVPNRSNLSGTGGREAWFTEDGFPRQTKEGSLTATYTFKSADDVGPIDVPERFIAEARRYIESLSPKEPGYSAN
jgi:hypothetical protein